MQIQKNTQAGIQNRQRKIRIVAFGRFSLDQRAQQFRLFVLLLIELLVLRALISFAAEPGTTLW
jgi:hypothetical protein